MMLPQYLDLSIRSFSENQEKMRDYMQGTFGTVFPFGPLEEMGKKNMEMFERTMQMFSPFPTGESPPDSKGSSSQGGAEKVSELEEQLAEMQKKLQALRKG